MESVDNPHGRGDTTPTVRAEKSIVGKPIVGENEQRVRTIHGRRVVSALDLARLYGVLPNEKFSKLGKTFKKKPRYHKRAIGFIADHGNTGTPETRRRWVRDKT